MKWLAIGAVLAACSSSSAPTPSPTGSATAAGSATMPAKQGGSPFETFATTFPKVGDPAPEIALSDSEGKPLKLSEATARGPVVLVWGSFT